MADVQFAPPLQRLTSPPQVASGPAASAPADPGTRHSGDPCANSPATGHTTAVVAPPSGSPRHQPGAQPPGSPAAEQRDTPSPQPTGRSRSRRKKLLVLVVLFCVIGGAGLTFRNAAAMQKLLGARHSTAHAARRAIRPAASNERRIHSHPVGRAERRAQQRHDQGARRLRSTGVGESTVESQIGGVFTTTTGVPHRRLDLPPGPGLRQALESTASCSGNAEPIRPADFIPMIDDIVDQPLRDAMQPTSSKSTRSTASRSDV